MFSCVLIIQDKAWIDKRDIERNWIIERTNALPKLILTEIAEIIGLRGIEWEKKIVRGRCSYVFD